MRFLLCALCLLLALSAPASAAAETFWSSDRLDQRDPTLQDDANAGYKPGDLWMNQKDHKAWKLADGTTGAAKWDALPWPTKPVVDAVSVPCALAVGTKPLKASYTGSLLALLRENNKAENSFGAADGNLNTGAVSAFLKDQPGLITKLYDQCGDHNLTAISENNRAGYSLDKASGQGLIMFDGLNHMNDQKNAPLFQNPAGPTVVGNNFSAILIGTTGGAAIDGAMLDFNPALHTLLMGSLAGTRTYLKPGPQGGSPYGVAFESVPGVMGLTSGKTVRTYFNGRVQDMGGNYPATALMGLSLGGSDITLPYAATVDLMAMMVFAGELSVTDIENLNLAADAQFGLVPQARTKFIGIGDSISAGYGANTSWLREVHNKLPGTTGFYSFAVPGIRAMDWLKNIDHITSVFAHGEKYVIAIDLGANDIKETEARLPDAVYADVTAIRDKLHGAAERVGAKVKIGIATVLPNLPTTGQFDQNRLMYNQMVTKNIAGFDFVIDFTTQSQLNAPGALKNLKLFPDNIHPSTMGQKLMADHAAAIVLKQ